MRVCRPQSYSKLDYTIDDLPRSNLKARNTLPLEGPSIILTTISVRNLRTRDKRLHKPRYRLVCLYRTGSYRSYRSEVYQCDHVIIMYLDPIIKVSYMITVRWIYTVLTGRVEGESSQVFYRKNKLNEQIMFYELKVVRLFIFFM